MNFLEKDIECQLVRPVNTMTGKTLQYIEQTWENSRIPIHNNFPTASHFKLLSKFRGTTSTVKVC